MIILLLWLNALQSIWVKDILLPKQRLWKVRASKVILATGAIERPLVFSGNDLPGIMLSAAIRTYINRYEVLSGRRAIIFTNNDDAYFTALAIHKAGGFVDVCRFESQSKIADYYNSP
ncbi:MAG: hypothetical protein CM15mP117_05910 [Alphaproteobacteria bacterium]|nr:MAG: hypothetical protein CM15mP117_05910 [Alphaproteobacteria bacterium]